MESVGFWSLVGTIITDFLTQCVPGSVVLLIVGLAMFPYAWTWIKAYMHRSYPHDHDQ